MQEAHINNIVIRYDKSTGEVFVGHAKKRELIIKMMGVIMMHFLLR